ncbi:hypothetical protein D046_8336, partial [Vibrio parahaemolyticus V-223/04]
MTTSPHSNASFTTKSWKMPIPKPALTPFRRICEWLTAYRPLT